MQIDHVSLRYMLAYGCLCISINREVRESVRRESMRHDYIRCAENADGEHYVQYFALNYS